LRDGDDLGNNPQSQWSRNYDAQIVDEVNQAFGRRWRCREENAKIIARIVRAESRCHLKLILVSTSEGGPETALGLGKILKPGETTSVKA
jgi:hypothetical protein